MLYLTPACAAKLQTTSNLKELNSKGRRRLRPSWPPLGWPLRGGPGEPLTESTRKMPRTARRHRSRPAAGAGAGRSASNAPPGGRGGRGSKAARTPRAAAPQPSRGASCRRGGVRGAPDRSRWSREQGRRRGAGWRSLSWRCSGDHPTDPSICNSISRFISTAYSMGSSLTSGSMKPATIIVLASASVSPRLVR